MPPELFERLERFKAVEREYFAARLAITTFSEQVHSNPTLLGRGEVRHRDLTRATAALEGTYLVRMFTEFEVALRAIWSAERTTNPTMHDLLQSLGANHRIPHDQLRDVQRVREYRNSLVHEQAEQADPIPISTSRSYLCRFLGRLR